MPPELLSTRWELPRPQPDDDDLIAVGADLEPGTLLAAYRQGLFPLPLEYDSGTPSWWSPQPRAILPLHQLRISRSMRRSSRRFTTTVNHDFEQVIAGCADPSRPHGWLDADFIAAYHRLHTAGWAHSVEVWHHGQLAGGLYGVAIGGFFSGESMFHRRTDASKVALMALAELLLADGVPRLLDVQWLTPHLESLGAVEVSREEYLRRLEVALRLPAPQELS